VPNSPGAGCKLQPGPGCDCCHGYRAEGCRITIKIYYSGFQKTISWCGMFMWLVEFGEIAEKLDNYNFLTLLRCYGWLCQPTPSTTLSKVWEMLS
jgi:hypothetical protein